MIVGHLLALCERKQCDRSEIAPYSFISGCVSNDFRAENAIVDSAEILLVRLKICMTFENNARSSSLYLGFQNAEPPLLCFHRLASLPSVFNLMSIFTKYSHMACLNYIGSVQLGLLSME